MPLDYDAARALLEELYAVAEADLLNRSEPEVPEGIKSAFSTIFKTTVQAYREVLVGCAIARIQDKTVNVRLPYVNLGPNAYNGRTLDERVVNPLLHDKQIPSSRGPFLSVFRRSVKFDEETRVCAKYKATFDEFLKLVTYLERTDDNNELQQFLRCLLFKFVELREASVVPLARIHRLSLEQYDALLSGLLATPSGGRFPVMLVLATLRAIVDTFHLNWLIQFQGINVADVPSGGAGDITVYADDRIAFAAEITERVVDRTRVVSTFKTKIAPYGIEDYLFFVNAATIDPEAVRQAQRYFSQGHEVSFLDIKTWIINMLATIGVRGRSRFNTIFIDLLDELDVPKALKVAWNEQVAKLTAI